jgi:branched-chain amino acid transport system permease protein
MASEATAQPLARSRYSIGLAPALGAVLVALVLVWLIVNSIKTPSDVYANFLIGLTNGAIYGIVALGYSLVYGILELINFAHGDVFMLGGWASIAVLTTWFGMTDTSGGSSVVVAIAVALVMAMLFCAVLNVTVEFVAYRRLRGAPRLAPLITAIGASFILQNVGLWRLGPASVSAPDILPHGAVFTIGGIAYTWAMLIVLAIVVPLLLLLMWLVQRTRQGRAMRATAQDQDAAAMMGVNVNRTISFTFFIAGLLAGAAGVLFILYQTSVNFQLGFRLGLFAFTAAVLGGIGNLPGAVLGGMLIGLIEAFNNGLSWHSPGGDWTNSVIFSVLILILVFRPEGLLGERTPEGG